MAVLVAGATGNLGQRIVAALIARGAEVTALGRVGTSDEKVADLKHTGATVVLGDTSDADAVAEACENVSCVVSALQGLRDVVVNTQTVLLNGALNAGVPRFIPSDFSVDFTTLPHGENRNFDLRREFHQTLHKAPIAATSIFNGAFSDVLTYGGPLLNFKEKTVGYWENPDWFMDFTTMDDTAAYTADAALDRATPKSLAIASFQVTPNDLVKFTADVWKTPYQLTCLGSLEALRAANQAARSAHPEGENELYAGWQQSQYLQSMFTVHHNSLDNARYPDLTWEKLENAVKPPKEEKQ